MGTISLEKRDSLFWLGRYTERVYTTLKAFYNYYDQMIDRQADAYKNLCERLDIPNIYQSETDFIHRFLFDKDDPNSIFTSLNRSYDNGIILRNEITSDSLAYIQMSLDIYAASSHSDVPTMALLPCRITCSLSGQVSMTTCWISAAAALSNAAAICSVSTCSCV